MDSSTKVRELTTSLGNLPNLRTLILHNTKSPSLPQAICNLINLEVLIINDPKFKSIFNSISNLRLLQVLKLNSPIEVLPNSILELKTLKKLKIWRNFLDKNSLRLINSQNLKRIEPSFKNILIFEKRD